jgi:hypothetical protein
MANLRRSSEECRMCDLLCKALQDGLGDMNSIWDDTRCLNLRLTKELRPSLHLEASSPTGPTIFKLLTVHTEEDDPSILAGLRPRLPLRSSTSSSESYATAREWIRECMSGHPHVSAQGLGNLEIKHSGMSSSDRADKPRRLVHLQPCGSGLMLRLIDALSDAQAYATLSHCVRKSTFCYRTKLIHSP